MAAAIGNTQHPLHGNNKAGPKDFSASSNAEAVVPSTAKRVRSSSSGEKRQRQRRSSSTKKESMVDPRMAKAVKAKQADPEMMLWCLVDMSSTKRPVAKTWSTRMAPA